MLKLRMVMPGTSRLLSHQLALNVALMHRLASPHSHPGRGELIGGLKLSGATTAFMTPRHQTGPAWCVGLLRIWLNIGQVCSGAYWISAYCDVNVGG